MAGMRGLVVGPLLRYVDVDSATIWVETERAAEVTVRGGRPRRDRTDVRRARPPLRARRARPGWSRAATRRTRLDVDGEQVWPEPGSPYPPPVIRDPRPGKPLRMAFGSCRVSVPHDEEGTEAFGVDALRAYALAHGAAATPRVARPGALPRRPGLRRRDQRGDAGVHRVPTQPRRATGGGAQGLRGVRPPLPARLERPREPLAAVDAAERDDLRRPRHPRRLEHQLDVAPGDGGDVLVAATGSSAGWRRTGSTSTWATSAATDRAEDPLWQRIAALRGCRTSWT